MRIRESYFYSISLKLTNVCWLYFFTSVFSNSLESLLPRGRTTSTVSSNFYKEKGAEKSQFSAMPSSLSSAVTVIMHYSSLLCQYQSFLSPTCKKNCWSVLCCWKARGRVHLLTRIKRGKTLTREVKICAYSHTQLRDELTTS